MKKFMSSSNKKSRIAKQKKRLFPLSRMEALELRRLMSVSASTLIGPGGSGVTWDYESLSNGVEVGTSISTSLGSTTFDSQTAGDRKTVSNSQSSGYTITSHSYDATTSDGIVEYGSTDSTTNASGGVISSSTDTNSPPDLVFPTTLVAGTVYSSNYTDTFHDTTPGATDPDTTDSETDSVELTSDTTQSVTVPAGTYNAYVVTFTTTTSSEGSANTTETSTEYFAAGVGLIKSAGSSGTDTFEEDLTSFNGGSSGGGGGGTTGGGGGTTTNTGSVTPIVLKTSLPASVVAGGTSHGTATVSLANTTSAKIKESVTTEVFASLDGEVDSASVLIGTLTKTVSVNAGSSTPVSVSIKSLPASLNGQYTVLARATDTAGTSSSTTGPALNVTAPFVAFSSEVLATNLTGSVVSGSKTKDTATLTLTNMGNVASTGSTTVDLFVSPNGTVASGTSIRSPFSQSIVIQPGKSKTVKFALETLPNVANNTYQVVVELTDPKGNITSVATASTVLLDQPYLTLTPTLSVVTLGAKGTGTVSLTLTNSGNYVPKGTAQVVFYASPGSSIDGAIQQITAKAAIPQPGKSKTIKYRLSAAQMSSIIAEGQLVVVVTDPLGGVLTAFTAG